jgi:hypothetical protein
MGRRGNEEGNEAYAPHTVKKDKRFSHPVSDIPARDGKFPEPFYTVHSVTLPGSAERAGRVAAFPSLGPNQGKGMMNNVWRTEGVTPDFPL